MGIGGRGSCVGGNYAVCSVVVDAIGDDGGRGKIGSIRLFVVLDHIDVAERDNVGFCRRFVGRADCTLNAEWKVEAGDG